MKKITLLDFHKNRTRKTNRWLGLLTFCMMLLVGQMSFAQYCTPVFASGCASGDQINNFEIPTASFSHLATGCSTDAYGDFTSMTINLYIGGSYDFTVTHSFATQHVRIWIDFNDDEEFDDTTGSVELVAAFSSTGSGAATITNGTIVIPSSVSPGTYRMRVADRYSSQPIPCNTSGFGEAHDYTVQVSSPPPCTFPPGNLTATNFTDNSVDLGWSEPSGVTSWDIEWGLSGFTPTGTPTITGVSTNPYTLTGLTSYTEYQFYVRSDCGSGDLSTWAGPYTFKTLYDCSAYTGDITSVTDGAVCDEGTATLQATATGTGSGIYWFDAAVGGNIVGQGTSFETPNLTETTSFWAAEVQLGTQLFTGQGNVQATTLGSTTGGGITFVLNQTASIISFEARSTTAAGGAVTYALIDVNNGNSVLMTHDDTLPGGGTGAAPVLYTVNLNFNNIPPGTYRLIKQSGAASAYMTGAFPYPLGTAGSITNGAGSATSTSTLYYHFFNITIEEAELLCESNREEVVTTVHEIIDIDVTATATSVSPGDSTTLTASSTNTNYTYAWSWDGGSDTGAVIMVSPTVHTTYTVTATDTVTGCQTQSEIEILVFDTTLCNTLEITDSTDGNICNEGTTTLQAVASGTGSEIYWYDAEVDGNLLGQGASFETPNLTETTSYWAAEVLIESTPLAGQAFANPTVFTNSVGAGGLIFNVTEQIKIVDVEVFGTNATGGDITIELRDIDNGNATVATATATITGGGTVTAPIPHTITLNFDVSPGNYRLVKTAPTTGIGLGYVTAANSNFPYPLGESGQVTGGATATGTSTIQYFFFNWTIEEQLLLCESDREEAVATVHIPATVEATSSAVPTNSVSPGGSTTLTASSTNDPNYTYVWEPASEIAGSNTGASVTTEALSVHTTFTVTATDTVTGCTTTSDITINVFDITECDDLEILTVTDGEVCGEGMATLQATSSGTGDEIYWYDAAVGGNLVGEGASFETPNLTATTSYWASEVLLGGGTVEGQAKPAMTLAPATGTSTSGANWGLMIDAYEPFTIVDVTIYSTGAGGDITVELQDETGTPIDNVIVTVPGGGTATAPVPYVATLNLEVPAAGTYRLLRTSSATVNMVRETSGNAYPYPLGTVGQIPSGFITNPGSTTYYWFYNWTVSTSIQLCESDREEAVATVIDNAVPTGDSNQEVASGSTLADLTVTAAGTLTWYADEDLTTVLADTEPITNGATYYVTQTTSTCESDALAITATFSYCIPTYGDGCVWGDDIDDFIMAGAGISHLASDCSTGAYGDFTADPTLQGSVQLGVSYDFSATHNFGGQFLKIWIDFDNNGLFEESELLFTSSTGSAATSGTITIPTDVSYLGNRRMRVQGKWNSASTNPCAPGGYGETHDYTVEILPAPPCLAPTNLSASVTSFNSADLSWDGTSGLYEIEWGVQGFTQGSGTTVDNLTTSSYSLSGLTADTYYSFYVLQDCDTDGVSNWTGPYTFFTGYCTVSTTNSGDYISAFSTTGAIQNVSYTATSQPAGSYANETAQVFQQIQGGTIDFTAAYVGGSFALKIWVDINNDLVFDETTEVVFFEYGASPQTGSVTVPVDLPLGEYRVRVRGQWGSTANPPACGNVAWGSTIDFTLEVVADPCDGAPAPTFDQIDPICEGGTLLPLPTTSTNGVTGTWAPALDNTQTTTYTFTPDAGECGGTVEMTIVVNDAPEQPVIACYETATFNADTCEWEVTGEQPEQPVLACYETATFNDVTCEWDVTGDQPEQPVIACYETATFNDATCEWDVTGDQPEQPVLECYETATFNDVTCEWDVTGTAPATPTADSPQTLSDGQTVADIVVTDVTGTLTWYDNDGNIINDSMMLTEGSYTFWVTQTIDGCESDPIAIEVEVTLSRNDFDNASFRAYPNPVKDFFNVSYSKDITNVSVVNMLGQTVINQTVNATATQIDMTGLPTGNYLIKVTVDGAVKTVKVIKQ